MLNPPYYAVGQLYLMAGSPTANELVSLRCSSWPQQYDALRSQTYNLGSSNEYTRFEWNCNWIPGVISNFALLNTDISGSAMPVSGNPTLTGSGIYQVLRTPNLRLITNFSPAPPPGATVEGVELLIKAKVKSQHWNDRNEGSVFVGIQPDEDGSGPNAVADAYASQVFLRDFFPTPPPPPNIPYVPAENISHSRIPVRLGPSGVLKLTLYTSAQVGVQPDRVNFWGNCAVQTTGGIPKSPPKILTNPPSVANLTDTPLIYIDVNVFLIGWYLKS